MRSVISTCRRRAAAAASTRVIAQPMRAITTESREVKGRSHVGVQLIQPMYSILCIVRVVGDGVEQATGGDRPGAL